MNEINELYFQVFNKEPDVIGLRWNKPDELQQLLIKAIETRVEYNEYLELDPEERKEYDKGNLLF